MQAEQSQVESSISYHSDFLSRFQSMSDKQRNLHYAVWKERFLEEEYPIILSELNLSGTEKKLILSPFRSEKHPSFSVNFAVENPSANFLFYDFRTQQKGSGTLAFRLSQADLPTDWESAKEFLLQVAFQRDYPVFLGENNDKFIDVVARYKEKIQATFAFLKEKNVVQFEPFSLNNCFSNEVKCIDIPATINVELEDYLYSKFSDEDNEQLSSNNRFHLNENTDFILKNINNWLQSIKNDKAIAVWDTTGKYLINVLINDHLVIPFHKFDTHILPLINWQAQQKHFDRKMCKEWSFALEDEANNTMPTAKLAKSYMIWYRQIKTHTLNYRNAAYLLLKFGQHFHFPDDVELAFVAAIYNQLLPEQYILIQGIDLFSWLWKKHKVVDFQELVQKDKKALLDYMEEYDLTPNNWQRKRFGIVVRLTPTQERYNEALNKVLSVLVKGDNEGQLIIDDVLKNLKPYINSEFQPVQGALQEPDFEQSPYMELPEVVSRLMLNNSLTNNLDRRCDAYMKFTQQRGIGVDVQKRFALGYGDESLLVQTLEQLGFSPIYFKDSQGHKKLFDGKIIFPIRDWTGNTLAFGARQLDPDIMPKYINSYNLEVYIPKRVNEVFRVFDKTHTWYGLYESKDEILKTGKMIIVEGYMDCISCHQHGFNNVIATMGTVISLEKVQPLLPCLSEVTVMLDGDLAGIVGMLNFAKIVKENFINDKFSFMVLPNQLDPDDYLKEYGSKSLKEELALKMNCEAYIQYATELIVFCTQQNKWLDDEEIIKRKANGFIWAQFLMKLDMFK